MKETLPEPMGSCRGRRSPTRVLVGLSGRSFHWKQVKMPAVDIDVRPAL